MNIKTIQLKILKFNNINLLETNNKKKEIDLYNSLKSLYIYKEFKYK